LTIIEDLDGLINSSPEIETALLNLLDGFTQINNVVTLACTNYPEKLKDRILNRPSRFDRRYHIGFPNTEVREFYLRHKIKEDDLNEAILNKLVKGSEGMSIAHLGELVKSVYIFGKNVDDAIAELNEMKKHITSSNMCGTNKKIGYGGEN
jgi:ATP-dependent 26S proteasome regulatory subunit